MSRADKIRPSEKVPIYYSDFPINLDRNLITGQVAAITNEEAVKQSLISLILTGIRERPYQPGLGSRIRESLFGNIDDPLTMEGIKDSIKKCISDHEPRAVNVEVVMQPNLELNAYNVKVYFSLINMTATFIAELTIERIR